MTDLAAKAAANPRTESIARAFVDARLQGRALPGYPGGDIPASLAESYLIQNAAIGLYPDRIVGWKVGGIAPALQPRFGADRLAGPIFSRFLWTPGDSPTEFPVFEGGFAAVEAEFIVRVGRDAQAHVTDWTPESVRDLDLTIHVGVEFAGSPLATINELGPTVVASDFGNNAGEILGVEVLGWQTLGWGGLTVTTSVNGETVGAGSAANVAGGPLASAAFLANNVARRGLPLKAGQVITTGAVTGIHEVKAGDTAIVDFGKYGAIHCVAAPAKAQ